MLRYYESSIDHPSLSTCIEHIISAHSTRLESLQSLPKRADANIWHPFMQHTERNEGNIIAIDSAYGDHFQTYTASTPASDTSTKAVDTQPSKRLLKPAFDGSASWWTQGLGHGNPSLALVAAHAAGRYGHVMFASAAHEPAVSLAETLLSHPGNDRLTRCFYSDNGSTGMEVAIKMALKASAKRYDWDHIGGEEGEGSGLTGAKRHEIFIIGLEGSYHGDTIGTMDCAEPSTYNREVQWYKPRGHWFQFPTVKMKKGKWVVEPSSGFGEKREFSSLDEIFAIGDREEDAAQYATHIRDSLAELAGERAEKVFGGLIMEPVILGAGGMLFW